MSIFTFFQFGEGITVRHGVFYFGLVSSYTIISVEKAAAVLTVAAFSII